MPASKPPVTYHLAAPLHFVVSSLVQINAERVSIEGRRTVDIRDFEKDENKAASLRHLRDLPIP